MSIRNHTLAGAVAAAFVALAACDGPTHPSVPDVEIPVGLEGPALSLSTTSSVNEIITVTEDNLGIDWFAVVLDADATFGFVQGPDSPPFGIGSLQLTADDLSTDKVTLVTDAFDGRPIAELEALSYWTYRDGSSTSAGHVVPSINIFITNAGPDGDVTWAPLVWEPIYPFGADAITDGVWQQWDTMAESETSFAGGWWSTRALGAICAFDCFVSWETVQEENPHATMIVAGSGAGAVGINLGRGPGGSFLGAADGLLLTMDGATTTFDFEPKALEKGECKDGGWRDLTDGEGRPFVNQGDCVSYFASEGRTRRPR